MTRLLRDELESVIRSYGSQSARLILHAEADASSLPALRKGLLSDGMPLTFVCLSVLRDEVRKEARSAFRTFSGFRHDASPHRYTPRPFILPV